MTNTITVKVVLDTDEAVAQIEALEKRIAQLKLSIVEAEGKGPEAVTQYDRIEHAPKNAILRDRDGDYWKYEEDEWRVSYEGTKGPFRFLYAPNDHRPFILKELIEEPKFQPGDIVEDYTTIPEGVLFGRAFSGKRHPTDSGVWKLEDGKYLFGYGGQEPSHSRSYESGHAISTYAPFIIL